MYVVKLIVYDCSVDCVAKRANDGNQYAMSQVMHLYDMMIKQKYCLPGSVYRKF